jgi:DNA-binding GntR family transcriptional regulator
MPLSNPGTDQDGPLPIPAIEARRVAAALDDRTAEQVRSAASALRAPGAGQPMLAGLPQRVAAAVPEAVLAQALIDAIVFGELRPRERLVEEELAERHEAKRHVVRAALDIVAGIGIVEKVRNRGVQVKEFSLEELTGIYAMRRLLQTEAAATMPLPAEPELLAGLERLQQAHAEAIGSGQWHRAHHLNRSFHELMGSACGNPYLASTVSYFELLLAAARSFRMHHPQVMAEAPAQHAAMIDAIRRQDRAALIDLVLNHLRPARETYALMKGVWSTTE